MPIGLEVKAVRLNGHNSFFQSHMRSTHWLRFKYGKEEDV